MRNVRLICRSGGADEFNVVALDGSRIGFRFDRIGAGGSIPPWRKSSATARRLRRKCDDSSTLSEIALLASVIENVELRTAITAAIASVKGVA
jgi:hypothetical protein